MNKIPNHKIQRVVPNKFINLFILAFLIFFTLVVSNSSAVEQKAVAIVLGKKITASDLEWPAETLARMKKMMSPERYAQWKNDSKKNRFIGLINSPLIERYLKTHGLTATRKEIDEYNKSIGFSMDKIEKEWRNELIEKKRQVNDPTIDQQQKGKLQEEIKTLEKILQSRQKTNAVRGGNSKSNNNEQDEMVSEFIKMWKLNKALYQKFGGRVIFQQSGFDPIGAREAFVREQQKMGNLKIFDPKYAQQFWAQFSTQGIIIDKEKVDEYYKKPWWLWTPEEQMKFNEGPR